MIPADGELDPPLSLSETFSAYVPCYNNAPTVGRALLTALRQTFPPAQLFLIDDGSCDDSCDVAMRLGVAVEPMGTNQGRGAVRARAMELARHDLVLCCDATNELPSEFAALALQWFSNPKVAAVFGGITQRSSRSVSDRWRARHLFKNSYPKSVRHGALLSTWGCVLRRSAVLAVGNFNPSLRHSEDAELGHRLLGAGFDVIYDPRLQVISGISNTPLGVLERYWRWNAGVREEVSFYIYAKLVWYSLRVLVPRDLADRDPFSVPLSLLCPHYQFWKSCWRHFLGRSQN